MQEFPRGKCHYVFLLYSDKNAGLSFKGHERLQDQVRNVELRPSLIDRLISPNRGVSKINICFAMVLESF